MSAQDGDLGEGDMGDADGIDESDGNTVNQEDAEGFRAVLSRRGRTKQRVSKADTLAGEGGPSGGRASGTVLDSVDHTTLCRHTVQNVPAEQFVSVMEELQHSFLETMAAAAHDRGLADATGRPLRELR